MAITQTYVDYGTGNDYNGASFTDGAFTVADMTLTKTGAFTKSKANHWLYLTDNGSGQVTAGYYKIASVTSANAVVLATSPKSGATDPTDVKCTQATGTTLLPFRSVQGALDIITRDATNGDQINIKASTAQVNQAALTLTTYGAPGAAVPLTLRGYTTANDDGGIGEIDCNGATMWAAATYDYIILAHLKIHNFGDNNGIVIRNQPLLFQCEIYKGASSPSGKSLVSLGTNSRVISCYVHDVGAGTAYGINVNNYSLVYGNYIVMGAGASGAAVGITTNYYCPVINNIVVCQTTGVSGIQGGYVNMFIGNSVYNSAAGTARGIYMQGGDIGNVAINNVVEGWSGAGGDGIELSVVMGVLGYNAFFNNANPLTFTGRKLIDLTLHDVTLGASAFTNPAGANFAVSTALKALGFPASFLGASTNTYIDIGAAQRQEPAGGAVSISPTLGSVGVA